MITIYKYPLVLKDDQTIDLPVNHKVLSVGCDGNNQLCIWVQVESDDYVVPVHFYVIGTGNPMPYYKVDFLGTVRQNSTALRTVFMWHIFKECNDDIKKDS